MNPVLILVLAVSSAVAQTDQRPLQGAAWARHPIDEEGRGADGTKSSPAGKMIVRVLVDLRPLPAVTCRA